MNHLTGSAIVLETAVSQHSSLTNFVIKTQVKSLHLSWYEGALVPMELVACTCGNAPSMLKAT